MNVTSSRRQSQKMCSQSRKTRAKRQKVVTPLPPLPDDMMMEILFRVPVRTLGQLKCVCKTWKTLISDPQFAKDHFRASTAYPNMAHQLLVSPINDRSKMVSYSVKSLFQKPSSPAKGHSFEIKKSCRILGSCNGLVCLYDVFQSHVTFWNPAIRSVSKTLPIGGNGFTCYGFGYDHVKHKFKLLIVFPSPLPVTKLFTLGATSICTMIENFPCHATRRAGKFLKGTLNWIARRGEDEKSGERLILSFDLVTEAYGEVLLPNRDYDEICNPSLDVLRGCLCVCFTDYKKGNWSVWLMKDYGVQLSWTMLSIISHVTFGMRKWMHTFEPLCISENGVLLVKTPTSKLALYNLVDDRIVNLKVRGRLGFDHTHIYHESLVSPQF
ncbi:unnamed protein product [Sphenostylis stenocarpa]|uniref:F-box domain-containing protein n=1 Tax=Sphenostylis stenocarpa TaxID=92480 RepID=A0AA87B762_9FABA|nr:unnamed protein product [Sphenostylis stenocarpa]